MKRAQEAKNDPSPGQKGNTKRKLSTSKGCKKSIGFKDVDGNSLGTNVLVKVLLPRMVEEGETTETIKEAGATANSSSKWTVRCASRVADCVDGGQRDKRSEGIKGPREENGGVRRYQPTARRE